MTPFDQNIDNDPGHVIDQDDLIAFHLHELSPQRERALRRALRTSPALQSESLAITTTLLAFPKHEPALPLDAAALDRHWQTLRPFLAAHVPPPAQPRSLFTRSPFSRWALPALAGSALVTTALVVALHHSRRTSPIAPTPVATTQAPASTPSASSPLTPSTAAPLATEPSSGPTLIASTQRPWIINHPSPPAPALFKADTTGTTPSLPPAESSAPPTQVSPENATASTTKSQAFQPATAAAPPSPTQLSSLRPPKVHHPHPADFTLAMFGNLPAGNSSSSTSGAGASAVTQTLSQTGTNAVGALASFHQQFSPWVGYRITTTYSRPTLEATSETSSSSGKFSTGGFPLAQSIYELSGTYTVQGPRHHRLSTSVEAGASLLAFSSTNPYASPSTTIHSFHGAAVAGVGSELALNKHWALRAEYRLLLYKPPAFYDTNNAPTAGNLTLSSNPILGITYRFAARGND